MQKIIAFFTLLLFSSFAFGQSQSFQLSSHILDVSTGQPVPNVIMKLQKLNNNDSWSTISSQKTDENGRVKEMLPYGKANNNGIYKLIFETNSYFESKKIDTFYPFIEVIFEIKDQQHYHVPIIISPFGYSTYKGN